MLYVQPQVQKRRKITGKAVKEGEPAAAAASPAASATDVRVEIPVLSSRTDIPKGAELLLYEKAVVRAESPRRIPIGTLMRAKRPSTSASA